MSVVLDENFTLHSSPGATLISGAPQDVIDLTHPKWAAYPPSHPFVHLGFAAILSAAWLASTVGNSVVIYVFLK